MILIQNNSTSSISFCKKCKKNIKDNCQKGLSISFNPIMNNFFALVRVLKKILILISLPLI